MRLSALSIERPVLATVATLLLMLFGIFWLAVGYMLFSLMERRARQTGAIGQY